MNTGMICLRGKIKGLASEGEKIRKRIPKFTHDKRDSLWRQKRAVGANTRVLMLAYGFLRGIPYHRMEKNCSKQNPPSAAAIYAVLIEHSYQHWTIQMVRDALDDKIVRTYDSYPHMDLRQTVAVAQPPLEEPKVGFFVKLISFFVNL